MLGERDLSVYLRISIPCLKYWRSVGYGPAYSKCKKKVYYEASLVERWLKSCIVEPGEDPAPEEDFLIVDGVYDIFVSARKKK